jgi:hypothetical protein
MLLMAATGPLLTDGDEYKIKSAYIERFIRFIEWPGDRENVDPATPFIIGVIGKDNFGDNLNILARKFQIKNREIKILYLKKYHEINGVHVLFIARSERYRLKKIIGITAKKPILTIGDTPGFAQRGVLVNFFFQESRIRFEINLSAVEGSGLHFKTKILKYARLIQ